MAAPDLSHNLPTYYSRHLTHWTWARPSPFSLPQAPLPSSPSCSPCAASIGRGILDSHLDVSCLTTSSRILLLFYRTALLLVPTLPVPCPTTHSNLCALSCLAVLLQH